MDPLRKDDVRATSENKAPRFTIVLLLPYCSRLHAPFKTGQVTLLNTIGKGYRRRDNGSSVPTMLCYSSPGGIETQALGLNVGRYRLEQVVGGDYTRRRSSTKGP